MTIRCHSEPRADRRMWLRKWVIESRVLNPDGKGPLAMTSVGSRKARPTTFSAPRDLTPAEIESLRAHKKELSWKFDEIDARRAAEKIERHCRERAARQ
jgi:hypothetical protein